MARNIPAHYKKAEAKANKLLAEGATRIMAICGEADDKATTSYELKVSAEITVTITKKPRFIEDKAKHGV